MTVTGDRDYRMSFNIEQLKLPPPPPPPAKQHEISHIEPEPEIVSQSKKEVQESTLITITKSPRVSDNIESIDMDMDLSDDDFEGRLNTSHDNLKLIVDGSKEDDQQFSLEPPPPLPDLPDDVDANNLLDDLSTDLHEFSNLSDELNNCGTAAEPQNAEGSWNQAALLPPPGLSMNFRDLLGAPPPGPPHLGGPPPMMNVPTMAPHPMNAPPPPPIPPSTADMMSPPPMPMMPPPLHANWLSKDTGDMMHGQNDGIAPPWMNDKDQQQHNQWTNDVEQWENEEFIGE